MADLVLHESTSRALAGQRVHPHHAILLVGPKGAGKTVVATVMAAEWLETRKPLTQHPYAHHIKAEKSSSIPIEAVRALEGFLAHKVPGQGKRVVLIENAHLLTTEAQNALLKTLEEPPANTQLILTALSERSLLPTVVSRTHVVPITRPPQTAIQNHFKQQGHGAEAIKQAQLLSGGLPGLMHALLNEEAHPLTEAVQTARMLLQKTTFERLALVDSLAKDRQQCLDVLSVLQHMSSVALQTGKATATWQRILQASYQASEQLAGNAQPKLVLTNLMLVL